MTGKCTWFGCASQGKYPQTGKSGEVWAFLCDSHNAELSKAIDDFDARKIVASWIKAQGGSKKAAKRMNL